MQSLTQKQMPSEIITTASLLKHGAIAFFGALVHALAAHRDGQAKTKLDIVTLTVISSFSGVIFGLLSCNFLGDSYISLAITGSGGYLGVEGLKQVTAALKKSILVNLGK